MLLVFVTGAMGIHLWLEGDIGPGAIAIVMSLAIRLTGLSHWVMWEVNALFENIGTVQDGINTLSKPQQVVDTPDAKELCIQQGAISFNHVGFAYHPNAQHSAQIFDDLNLHIVAGEKVGIVVDQERANQHSSICYCDFTTCSMAILPSMGKYCILLSKIACAPILPW